MQTVCASCRSVDRPVQEPHTCRVRELKGDTTTLCNCCERCTRHCREYAQAESTPTPVYLLWTGRGCGEPELHGVYSTHQLAQDVIDADKRAYEGDLVAAEAKRKEWGHSLSTLEYVKTTHPLAFGGEIEEWVVDGGVPE